MANLSDYVIAEQPPYKVILCGMKGVGKTSLMKSLDTKLYTDFDDDRSIVVSMSKESRRDGNTKLKLQTQCNGRSVPVEVWDTGNMETHSSSLGMTKSYFRDVHGAILVYEKGREESKTDLKAWAQMTLAGSPDCVLSLWCNNREAEFGRGAETRDFISVLETHYGIPSRLIFSYIPNDNIEQIHNYFNRLVCEIHSRLPSPTIRQSISVDRHYHDQSNVQQSTLLGKCCKKMS